MWGPFPDPTPSPVQNSEEGLFAVALEGNLNGRDIDSFLHKHDEMLELRSLQVMEYSNNQTIVHLTQIWVWRIRVWLIYLKVRSFWSFFKLRKVYEFKTVSGNFSNHIIISVYINLLMRKGGNNYKWMGVTKSHVNLFREADASYYFSSRITYCTNDKLSDK